VLEGVGGGRGVLGGGVVAESPPPYGEAGARVRSAKLLLRLWGAKMMRNKENKEYLIRLYKERMKYVVITKNNKNNTFF
jgi:hypothetical protein